jgi:hypothetical protein
MRRRRDTPRTDGGARRKREREPAAEALERRYRWLLAWYPAAYRAANADDMLGVALARSASGQRWPEPGEAVNLIVSGIGERLGTLLRQPDQRDTAAVLTIAGPMLLAAAAAILAGWPAAEMASVTYTRLTANSGTISDPLSGTEGWLTDGLFAVTLILMLATIAALRPAVRRRAVVLLLPAFVTTALVCWGFQGFLRTGLPFDPLMLSPLQWQDLVLVPVIGVVACFIGLRLYERLLRRREAEKAG